jgi:hypothetical protein
VIYGLVGLSGLVLLATELATRRHQSDPNWLGTHATVQR